jgi:hypothetical protein
MTVVLGLVSFALVLALVEQVVLEVLESNVKQGSQVYEEGHVSAGAPFVHAPPPAAVQHLH